MSKKLISVLLVLVTCISLFTLAPATSLAESKTYKSTSSYSYRVTTGRKASTLTITPYKGTRAQEYVLKDNARKKHTVKQAVYASYTVIVDGREYKVTNRKVTVSLSANTTHSIRVKYNGLGQYCFLYYSGTLFNPSWKWKTSGSEYWAKDPSIKLNVNQWARIN